LLPRHGILILCDKPGDGHCRTVDAATMGVEDGGVHGEEKPDLVEIMGVVGKGVGLGLGLGVR